MSTGEVAAVAVPASLVLSTGIAALAAKSVARELAGAIRSGMVAGYTARLTAEARPPAPAKAHEHLAAPAVAEPQQASVLPPVREVA